jgi:hypothetical protein
VDRANVRGKRVVLRVVIVSTDHVSAPICWQLTTGADGATAQACGPYLVLIRRSRSVEPITVRPSPSAPSRAVPVWRAAARGVPAGVMTSGPTASDPTSSVPLPPAVTNVAGPLDRASSRGQGLNSRVREGQRKRTIRQPASCTYRHKHCKSSEHYSPHPNLPRAELVARFSQSEGV